MQKPLVIAYHLVWTAYGWWLPNDPRGSESKIVRNPTLAKIGNLHYGRKMHQPARREVRAFYYRAKPLLRHALLKFTPDEVATAARGLAHAITKHNYTCYACAIMPDHVHLVIRKHKHTAEEMIENLQTLSRERLVAEGFRDAGQFGPLVVGKAFWIDPLLCVAWWLTWKRIRWKSVDHCSVGRW